VLTGTRPVAGTVEEYGAEPGAPVCLRRP
jgi:hypothetical protein